MGHDTWRLPVEDHSVVVLRSPSAMCSVETGYTYPGPAGIWDLRFAVRTRRHHLILRSDNMIEIISAASREVTQIPTASAGNSYWYPRFVEETLRRFRRDEPPIATLDDLVAGMETVDAAYAAAAR
jgi:hypothetical protein